MTAYIITSVKHVSFKLLKDVGMTNIKNKIKIKVLPLQTHTHIQCIVAGYVFVYSEGLTIKESVLVRKEEVTSIIQ